MNELMAGRELDARIAETVMGLVIVAQDWPCGYLPPCYWLEASDTAEPTIDLMTERHPVYRDAAGELRPVPCYSTELATAWTVVRHLQRPPTGWRYNLYLIAYPYGRTYAYFGRDVPADIEYAEGNNHWAEDDSTVQTAWATPLAICRAALAALGQKE